MSNTPPLRKQAVENLLAASESSLDTKTVAQKVPLPLHAVSWDKWNGVVTFICAIALTVTFDLYDLIIGAT